MQYTAFMSALLFVIFCSVDSVIEMSHLLGTNQYMLISEQRCRFHFEVDVPEGRCPNFFLEMQGSKEECSLNYHTHLYRDVLMEEPPKLLLIGRQHNGAVSLNLQPIIVPPFSRDGSHVSYFDNTGRNVGFKNDATFSSITNFQHSVFDTRYKLLYILTSTDYLHVYYIENADFKEFRQGAKDIMLINCKVHPNAARRNDWFEDPYTFKVYYTERKPNGTVEVFEVSMERLMDSLLNGTPGKKVQTFNDYRRQFSISNGILFSRTISQEKPYVINSYLRYPGGNGAGIVCNHIVGGNRQRLPSEYGKLMIIRDWDYCITRYGGGFDIEQCDRLRDQWLIEQGLKEIPSSSSVSFWILLGFLVFMIVMCIFLIFLVVRMRRDFADEMEKAERVPVPYYPTNPHYTSEMSHMDVSVDRWNY